MGIYWFSFSVRFSMSIFSTRVEGLALRRKVSVSIRVFFLLRVTSKYFVKFVNFRNKFNCFILNVVYVYIVIVP